MKAIIDPRGSVLTQIDFIRVGTDATETEALVQQLERSEAALSTRPGLVVSSLHVSDDGAIIVWRQWADNAPWPASSVGTRPLAGGWQLDRLGQRDNGVYEVAYLHTFDGGPLSIEPGSRLTTLIDVEVTDPSRQRAILEFNIANSKTYATTPGLRATAVLRGGDGTRIATYSQWNAVEDWIAAVKTTAGGRIPALRAVETVQEVNAVLQQVSREMGSLPEYHAYRVASVTGPGTPGMDPVGRRPA